VGRPFSSRETLVRAEKRRPEFEGVLGSRGQFSGSLSMEKNEVSETFKSSSEGVKRRGGGGRGGGGENMGYSTR